MVILISRPLYLRGRAAGTYYSTTRLGGPQGQLGVLVTTEIAFPAEILSHYTEKAIPVPTKNNGFSLKFVTWMYLVTEHLFLKNKNM